jgi:hypothetical protein
MNARDCFLMINLLEPGKIIPPLAYENIDFLCYLWKQTAESKEQQQRRMKREKCERMKNSRE